MLSMMTANKTPTSHQNPRIKASFTWRVLCAAIVMLAVAQLCQGEVERVHLSQQVHVRGLPTSERHQLVGEERGRISKVLCQSILHQSPQPARQACSCSALMVGTQ